MRPGLSPLLKRLVVAMPNLIEIRYLVAAGIVMTVCGCTFAPKRDLTQLHLGNSRATIHSVLGKPAASFRHDDHDVDVYAFFQGIVKYNKS